MGSKLVELSIVFLTLLVLIYAFSFYRKLSQAEANEQKNLIFVRTQILNGCQNEGVAQRVKERLRSLKVNNMVYQIVEIVELEDFSPGESLILDRLGDQKRGMPSEVALLTAEALGIHPRNVICKKLDNNYQRISLIIVICDGGDIVLPST